MAKQILSDENLGQFATAIRGEEAPASPQGNEPAAPAPSGETHAGAPAGSTSSPERQEVVDEQPARETTSAKPEPEEPKGPIPYERFAEVNNERKEYLEKVRQYEQQLADVNATVKANTAQLLQQIAEARPELREAIYGKEALEREKPPEDPQAKKLWELEREVAENRRFREEMQKRDMIDDMEERANAAMKKHEIFNRAKARDHAHEVIATRLLANPKLPVEKIVEDVAADARAWEEEVKAQYRETKKQTAAKVPPGAGGGGAAPPGQPPRALKLNDGSALRAMVAALKGGGGEA